MRMMLWWRFSSLLCMLFGKQRTRFSLNRAACLLSGHDMQVQQRVYPLADRSGLLRWRLPPEGTIKVNVDASVSSSNGAGLGMVARNDRGEPMEASTMLVERVN